MCSLTSVRVCSLPDCAALLSGTLRTFQRHACDYSVLALRCPPQTTIDVLYAQYGRPSSTAPPHHQQQVALLTGAGGTVMMMRDGPAPYDPCPPIPGQHQTPKQGHECVMEEANVSTTSLLLVLL